MFTRLQYHDTGGGKRVSELAAGVVLEFCAHCRACAVAVPGLGMADIVAPAPGPCMSGPGRGLRFLCPGKHHSRSEAGGLGACGV